MNILFITADQWRAECLSVLGHQVRTPNLDALAKEGVLFKNHFAQATPCSPSRTSMHTGMYLQNHRCVSNGSPVDNRFTNWAIEILKAGYEPTLFGYTDTAVDPRAVRPGDRRLEHYSEPLPGIEKYTPMWDEVPVEWVDYLRERDYPIPEVWWDLYGKTVPGTDWADGGDTILPLAISAEDHETHYMVDRCIDWIKTQDKPWVTHLSLLRPHPPFAAPSPYQAHHDPNDMPLPSRAESAEDEAAQHPFLDYYINYKPKFRGSDNLRQIQQDQVHYYGLIEEVDANLGRLFDYLKSSGQWEDTLVIFTSDHGEQMHDHWLISKLGFYDESYHIPLIIRAPGSAADTTRGTQIESFTENVDIMPTLLDALNLEIPGQCDGFSLMPAIESGRLPDAWRKEVHWEFDFREVREKQVDEVLGITMHQCNLTVIRDQRYKYVHFSALPPLLYDLQKDPGEFVNQASNPEYQSIVLKYAQKMLSWKMNFTDRGLAETSLGRSGAVTRRAPLRQVGS